MNILHCLQPQKYVCMWGCWTIQSALDLEEKSLNENMHKSAQLQEISRFLSPPCSLFPWCTYYFFLPCLPPYRKSWGHQHVTHGACVLTSVAHHSTTFISFYGVALQLYKTTKSLAKPTLPTDSCSDRICSRATCMGIFIFWFFVGREVGLSSFGVLFLLIVLPFINKCTDWIFLHFPLEASNYGLCEHNYCS